MGRELSRDLSHVEAAELLGAFALDALEADERDAVARHVYGCGACQAEVSAHREVVAFLAPGWASAPAGVWERIAGSLEEAPPPLTMPPAAPVAPVVAIEARGRRWRPAQVAAAMVAVAALALVAVLGLKVVDDGRRIDQMKEQARGTELDRTVRAAEADPSARRITLKKTDGTPGWSAVFLPDGTGYLVDARLPDLPSDRTYQLWALVGTSRISVGVLGPKGVPAGFRAPPTASGFALTTEVAGGVVTSTNDPVVVGKF
ncbi:MAG: anti-sigma factor domain-containing protein [Acidimicrobiales bacterium]